MTAHYNPNFNPRPGAASEELTSEGLLCGHEYGLLGAYRLVDNAGQQHMMVKLLNPHRRGEWTGDFSDQDRNPIPNCQR